MLNIIYQVKRQWQWCVILLLSFTSMLANANTVSPNAIVVDHAYIRATIPSVKTTSAYMTINNRGDTPIHLVAVTSNFSKRIEMHEHSMTNGMMIMRQVPNIEIASHSQVKLQPYGYHLMIFNLAQPLVDGEQRTLTLQFDNHQQVIVHLPVQSIKKRTESH